MLGNRALGLQLVQNPEQEQPGQGILEEVFGPAARAPTKSEKEAVDIHRRGIWHGLWRSAGHQFT